MSGSHLHPEDEEKIEAKQAVAEVYIEDNVAVKVDGLKNWLSNLHVIDETDVFLRVKDIETGKVYLIKEIKNGN